MYSWWIENSRRLFYFIFILFFLKIMLCFDSNRFTYTIELVYIIREVVCLLMLFCFSLFVPMIFVRNKFWRKILKWLHKIYSSRIFNNTILYVAFDIFLIIIEMSNIFYDKSKKWWEAHHIFLNNLTIYMYLFHTRSLNL